MTTFTATPAPKSSPWGAVQGATELGAGVWSVHTAGHGGIKLSPARNAKVHEALRAAGGWYEEDCDWAVVAYTFPDLFKPEHVVMALESLRHWQPHGYMAASGEVLTPATSRRLAEEAFTAANAQNWVTVAAWGSWAAWVPDGKVGVVATIGGSREHTDEPRADQYALVDAAAYRARTGNGYVLDPARDQFIDKPANLHENKVRAA